MDGFSFSLVAVQETAQDKIAPSGSDFDYYKSIRSESLMINEADNPSISFKNSEFHLKMTGYFNGGDISFYGSNTYNNLPYNDFYIFNPLSGVLTLTPRYKKIKSSGITANLARNNFVFKLESAFIQNSAIQRNDVAEQLTISPVSSPKTWSEKDIIRSMAGFDYNGISDLFISVEGYLETTTGYQENLLPDRNTGMIYLSALYETLNATLDYNINVIYMTNTQDAIIKLKSKYDLSDGVSVECGVIFYEMTDKKSPYYSYRNNDRFFAGFKYSF